MTGKEYMKQIQIARRGIRLLSEQIERDSVLASGVKAIRYDVDKVQTSPVGDRMTDIVAGIASATDELKKKIEELQEKENEARGYLIRLREEHERVLVYHYFDSMRWEDVAEKMNYSDTYVYDLKNKALDELTEILKESEKI